MNLKEIKELIDALRERDIAEFEMERGNEKIKIRLGGAYNGMGPITYASLTPALAPAIPAPVAAPAAAAPAPAPALAPEAGPELHVIKSPIVGTFYDSPSPGVPAFVKIGDKVEAGQVLCIIEAMKLMNEIESDVAGVVEKRYPANQQPVEYGEALFGIRKTGP